MKKKTDKVSYDFQECATCASKPGSPDLCSACIHNRDVIYALAEMTRPKKKAKSKVAANKDCKCLELAQKAAAKKGFQYETCLQFSWGTTPSVHHQARIIGPLLTISWLQKGKRKRLPPAIPAYCPFCGKKKSY